MLHTIQQHKAVKVTGFILGIKLKILLFIVLPVVILTLITSQTDIVRGFKSFIVVSGSMEPSIPVGSIVYTQKEDSYNKGDVIAFTNAKGQTVTHRIAGIMKKDGIPVYKTKGDANDAVDLGPVAKENVVGKTFFTIPYVGRIISFIKTPVGFGLLIVLPTVLFILGELSSIKKEIEKEVEKRVLARVEKTNNI